MTMTARGMAVVALIVGARLTIPREPVTLTYDGVPRSVVKVQVFEWPDLGPPREVAALIDRHDDIVRVNATPGFERAVVFRRADGQYLVDGPFTWPAGDRTRVTPATWRTTAAGSVPSDVPEGAVAWISPHEDPGGWPRCLRNDDRHWQCWGVAAGTRGIMTLTSPTGVSWALVEGALGSPLRYARWGRMVMLSGMERWDEEVRVAFASPVAPPSERLAGIRLDTAPVANAQFVPLGGNAIWIAAQNSPALAWAEVRTDTAGPAYLSLSDLSQGPAAVPVQIRLPARRALAGQAASSAAEPARGALVTLFRAIDPPAPPGSSMLSRRVIVAETTTDAEGAFAFDRLGDAEYEVVAWHSQLGRASVALTEAQTTVSIVLQSTGVARGRVIASGTPLEGVDVISVPDAATFNAVKDLTEAKGGDARTGRDGRFTVAVANAGGGELRIGGGEYAVRRIPLPRAPVPILDLGDLELAAAIDVIVSLDRDVGCGVRAIGPIGRTGLQVLVAHRTIDRTFALSVPEPGLWQIGLDCKQDKHSLSPASVQIGAAQAGKELHFIVR